MPVAVITDPTVREELKSLPGAYVVIKKMTYGQKLTRTQMAMKMRMQVEGGGRNKGDTNIDIDMMNRLVSLWSFANLIADHNLEGLVNPDLPAEGDNLYKLNFKNVADVEKVAGPIGEEIDTLIDKINNFDEDADDVKNLSSGSREQ